MLRHATGMRRIALALFLVTSAVGCVEAPEPTGPAAISWQEFKEASTIHHEGRELYTVEEDLPVSLEELRAYYEAHVAAGSIVQESIVDRVNGADNVWPNGQQMNLTYCVSNNFGNDKTRAVNEIAAAAAGWESVATVHFVYLSAQDGNCDTANTAMVFSVRPWNESAARSFFPNDPQADRTLFMNFNAFPGPPSTRTTTGVFRHELGHILGLRHEHLRSGADDCGSENRPWDPLTEYDRASVMHYLCGGVGANSEISPLDAEGASALYGPRPARPGFTSAYEGCQGNVPRFFFHWHRFRGINPTRFVVEVRPGGSSTWSVLSDGAATSKTYFGANNRTDGVRLSACTAAGCSGHAAFSVRASCDTQPP